MKTELIRWFVCMTLLGDSDVTPDFYRSHVKIVGIPAIKSTGKERSTMRNQILSFHKALVSN